MSGSSLPVSVEASLHSKLTSGRIKEQSLAMSDLLRCAALCIIPPYLCLIAMADGKLVPSPPVRHPLLQILLQT